jgi:hypothetical protein
MTDLVQISVVALIGAGALAYLLRQAWRRLRPQPARKSAGCGSCSGCGACPSARR